jgi:hypothetical protein
MDGKALLKGWLTLAVIKSAADIVAGLGEDSLAQRFYPRVGKRRSTGDHFIHI